MSKQHISCPVQPKEVAIYVEYQADSSEVWVANYNDPLQATPSQIRDLKFCPYCGEYLDASQYLIPKDKDNI